MEVKDRLRIVIDSLGITLKEFSERTGIPYITLQHYLRGSREPGTENLQKIALQLDINLHWLLTGEGEPFIKKSTDIEKPVKEEEGFVYIPVVSGRISAGGGLVPDNRIEFMLAFKKDWIQKRGNPKNMSLIRITGDSMEPTLYSGDLVLVDHSRNYIDPQGGIYAITLDDVIMIKRLQLIYPSRKIRIISDNPKYESFEVDPDSLIINGKVIWFGRELEK